MSHFAVMVIGKDPEKQLKPYDENIQMPPTCKEQVEQEEMVRFFTHYSEEEQKKKGEQGTKIIFTPEAFEEMYRKKGNNWNGNTWRKHTDGTWWEYSTYNPQSKWDWYQLGGRWSGAYITHLKKKAQKAIMGEIEGFTTEEVKNFIDMARNDKEKFDRVVSKYNGKSEKIKKAVYDMIDTIDNPKGGTPEHKKGEPGVFGNEVGIDAAKKGDIDFAAIRKQAEDEACAKWDKLHEGITKQLGDKKEKAIADYVNWDKVRDELHKGNIEAAREFYGAQEAVKAFEVVNKDHQFSGFMGDGITPYLTSRELYMKAAGDGSFSTYAVVKDGIWYEKGEMGWWGMSSNEKDQHEWNSEVAKLLDGLSDDTLISIYDCHI